MLEQLDDESDYDNFIAEKIKFVKLLGELPFTNNDVQRLIELVKRYIKPNIDKGTEILTTYFPFSFACFLVCIGGVYYDKEKFWINLEKAIEIQLSYKYEKDWGEFFLWFLRQNRLPLFDEEEGLRYVTPILAHSCLPNVCVAEYFEKIVVPLTDKYGELVCAEIITKHLEEKRRRNEIRRNFLSTERGQSSKIYYKKKIKEYLKYLTNYLESEKEQIAQADLYAGLENASDQYDRLTHQIRDKEQELAILQKKKQAAEDQKGLLEQQSALAKQKSNIVEKIEKLRAYSNRINNHQAEIERCISQINTLWKHFSEETWNKSFEKDVIGFPIEEYIQKLIKYKENLAEYERKLTYLHYLNSRFQSNKYHPVLNWLFSLLKRIFLIRQHILDKREAENLAQETDRLSKKLEEIKDELDKMKGILPLKEDLCLQSQTSDLINKFTELKNLCSITVDLDLERKQLIEYETELTGELGRLFPSSNEYLSDLEHRISYWNEEIKRAEEKDRQLKQVEQDLKKLQDLEQEIQSSYISLKDELLLLEERLMKIDKDSIEQGFWKIRNYLDLKERNLQARKKLSRVISKLASNVSFEELKAEVENVIETCNNWLEEIETEPHDNHRHQEGIYAGIDEPIRRFLLYGGDVAKEWLINSVVLYSSVKSGKDINQLNIHLPQRIIDQFQQWWQGRQEQLVEKTLREEKIGNEGTLEAIPEYSSGKGTYTPYIYWDAETNEVCACLPSQQVKMIKEDPILEIWTKDNERIFEEYQRRYSDPHNKDQCLLNEREGIPLNKRSEFYIFTLKCGNEVISRWKIDGIEKNAPCVAFLYGKKNKLITEEIPRGEVILLVKKNYKIMPTNCVKLKDELYGELDEFNYYETDLSQVYTLELIDSRTNEKISLPIKGTDDIEMYLIGGKQLSLVTVENLPVYSEVPLYLLLKLPTYELSELFLIVFNKVNKVKYSFKELEEHDLLTIQQEKEARIYINDGMLLGNPVWGRYVIQVGATEKQLNKNIIEFVVIPQMSVTFEKEVYPPYKDEKDNKIRISAETKLPETFSLEVDPPAFKRAGSNVIYSPIDRDEIMGKVNIRNALDNSQTEQLPIRIQMPKIKWCIRKDKNEKFEWKDKVENEEIWINELYQDQYPCLNILYPPSYNHKIRLSVDGDTINGKHIEAKRRIEFDLKALEDSFRSRLPKINVGIILNGHEKPFPLFTLQTQWVALDKKCYASFDDQNVIVKVEWRTEKGKRDGNVIAYLFGVQESANQDTHLQLIMEEIDRENKRRIEFTLSKNLESTLRYLVLLRPQNLSLPRAKWTLVDLMKDTNSQLIDIRGEDVGKTVTVTHVILENKSCMSLKYDYQITIKGKVINQQLIGNNDRSQKIIITPYNENWYIGEIEVRNATVDYLRNMDDTNPIKFECDSSKKNIIQSIEDRQGDGAYYCNICGAIFWSTEASEIEKKVNGHKLYAPISFVVEGLD